MTDEENAQSSEPTADSEKDQQQTPGQEEAGHKAEEKESGERSAETPDGDRPVDEAVRQAEEAISHLGEGTERAQYYREAGFTTDGDNVGVKNVFYNLGAARPRLQELSPEHIDAARDSFVDPPGWQDVRFALGNQPATILTGPAGCGKTTAAIRALLSGSAQRFYLLDEGVDLNGLAEALDTAADSGDGDGDCFLLIRPTRFAGLRAAALQRIAATLRKAAAHLVLIIDDELPTDPDLADHVVTLAEGPSFADVAARHLRAYLGEVEGELVAAQEGVQRLFERHGQRDGSCARAARLAEHIAVGFVERGQVDEEQVDRFMSGRQATEFDIWLGTFAQPRFFCLALALGTLDGFRHEAVLSAAARLYDRLERDEHVRIARTEENADHDEAVTALRETTMQRLRRLKARTRQTQVEESIDTGTDVVETIAYGQRDRWRTVLLHAWSQYPVHAELLDWLGELGDSPNQRTRVYVGRALGALASNAYGFVSGNALGPWANAESPNRRELVAHALAFNARDPRLARKAREFTARLYAQWEDDSRPSVYKLATAARIEGLVLGRLDRPAAVRALERLLYVDSAVVWIDVGSAFTDLLVFAQQDPATARNVTRSLLVSLAAAGADPRRTRGAQLAFLVVAVSMVNRFEDDPARAPWPALLTMTRDWPDTRAPIAALWRLAVTETRFHQAAQAILTRWARRAEEDPQLRTELAKLLRAVLSGDPRSLNIVERWAIRWAEPSRLLPLPETSAAVLAVAAAEKERLP